MTTETLHNRQLFNPKKFGLWLMLLSIVMIFASLTSAYIVRRAEGNWLEFSIPSSFLWSTFLIIASSITMYLAYFSAKKDKYINVLLFVLLTIGLGVSFMFTQVNAWGELVDMQVFFGGKSSNPAGSFMYVLTGVHLFHIISGLFFLLIVLYKSFRNKVNSANMLSIEMCSTYWHFLGLLWIYLYVFLIMYN